MLKIMRSTEKEVERIYKRTFEYSPLVEESVKNILGSVKEKGDSALFSFTKNMIMRT